jgi:hypothetical protein
MVDGNVKIKKKIDGREYSWSDGDTKSSKKMAVKTI